MLPTLLLVAYAGLQAFTFASCLGLFQSHAGDFSSFSALGLGAVAAISAGLVYENLVLAAGG